MNKKQIKEAIRPVVKEVLNEFENLPVFSTKVKKAIDTKIMKDLDYYLKEIEKELGKKYEGWDWYYDGGGVDYVKKKFDKIKKAAK